ncbi:ABC transporter transmembrane domain-containing protein [Amylibacter sp. IMCC11727]|uniref:ABC transporter transmembrane domain-containing protein n=1 Tax=Amylibacter sp. IMCC11727 TaxID=3039851 RepID=UPI00244DBFF5|nr:ABC transporter transmembrane domain-containing protein [Amylibacter sp. IMCC11727]WGI21263.1 ABC transporter transmembrane domain-containing protein [Amylibacter sp. IMCC11727]
MDSTLFAFIWKHSKRSQLMLLAVTLATFPLLYITLELPKRIINDAIGGDGSPVSLLGYEFSQIQFLLLLCGGFLLSVLANGLLKMRLNTMKGVLAERLLRRFRFQLLSRMLRFPRPYFRKTSQGELVSMVTSEAEPMGGLMGDMLSQPVFQAGQMLTILTFLFAQSFWFGLASVALIPLQAWLIPKLQRQINLLNKSRIQEVRRLAADIGETAAGVSDIRVNGGLRFRLALFSNRLGALFGIRFQIYQKKFFMKFLNNFINQLTPFFFYSVGGFLAIQGQITVGALVAALAAYKDLSSPWKELLAYYNQTQDMALRWEVVTERFAPKTLVEDALFEGEPAQNPSLHGDIVLKNVTVRDESDHVILDDLNLTIPAGARVAVKSSSESASQAFADLLTREVIPYRGAVTIAGQPLNDLHQGVVGSRIGYAHSSPYMFDGTLGDNLMLPLKHNPQIQEDMRAEFNAWLEEAKRSGNSLDPLVATWVDPQQAGFESDEAIRDWWFQIVEAMGIDEFMVRRALRNRMNPETQPELAKLIVDLRPEIAQKLNAAGLMDVVHPFDPEKFNPVSPLGSNLMYALPVRFLQQTTLAASEGFLRVLRSEGLIEPLTEMSSSVVGNLIATFGSDGTDHPLFRRLNMEDALYQQLSDIHMKRIKLGNDGLSDEELSLLMTVPFAFSAEQIGPAFDEAFKERVLDIRKKSADHLVQELGGLFEKINPDKYIPVMSVLGNAIFGRISNMAGARDKKVEDIVVEVINAHGWRRQAAQSIFDLEMGIGGTNLPAVFRERAAISRAGIKKPDILILQSALSSHDADSRSKMRERIGDLMPDATKIFIEDHFNAPETYDMFIEIENGRIDGGRQNIDLRSDDMSRDDLNRKLAAVSKADLFKGIDLKNQRLLAYSAQWYNAKAGHTVFRKDEPADAAYLCVSGKAGLFWEVGSDAERLVTEINPGRLIGDLAVILDDVRVLDLIAIEDTVFLRIGASELNAVIENDASVAGSLLRAVGGHLNSAADSLRKAAEAGYRPDPD